MASFQYRLQPLLDLKLERRDQAQRDLALRISELSAEQRALEEARLGRTRLEAKLAASKRGVLASRTGESGLAVHRLADYLRGLTADLDAAKDGEFSQRMRVREFEERLMTARRHLADCSREVEVLNRHRERLEQRFLRECEKREAAEQDEVGNSIFNRTFHRGRHA